MEALEICQSKPSSNLEFEKHKKEKRVKPPYCDFSKNALCLGGFKTSTTLRWSFNTQVQGKWIILKKMKSNLSNFTTVTFHRKIFVHEYKFPYFVHYDSV
jgi:hypothetical protein